MKQRVVWILVLMTGLAGIAVQAKPSRATQRVDLAARALAAIMGNGPTMVNYKDGCTASLTCPSGTVINCSSGVPGTCTVGGNSVTCNGVTTNCPSTCYLERECCDGSFVACEGTTCSNVFRGVKCDGVSYLCPPLRSCGPLVP